MSFEIAYRKIDSRLRAYGLDQMSVRHQVAAQIVQEAEQAIGEDSLEAKASRIFSQRHDQIVQVITQAHGVNAPQAVLMMRDANVSEIWRAAMIAPDSLPEVIAGKPLQALVTGPELTRSALGAPQIDFGVIEETTESTLAVLNRWPKLRFAGFLCLLGGLTAFIVSTAR